MKMGQIFSVGDKIYGYCQGYFGSSDYETKRCSAVMDNYAVFEYPDGSAVVVNYYDGLENDAKKWMEVTGDI